jgi:hypothetical protein
MLLMGVVYTITELVLVAVIVLQFLFRLVTGEPNGNLLRFGAQLAAFAYNIFLFLTFSTGQKPFPFQDWEASTRLWRSADEGGNRKVAALLTPDPRGRRSDPEE